MATKPDKFPEWANDNPVDPVSGQSARVAPPQSKKDSGWSREEVPPRQWFNWLSWKTNQWILWLEESVDNLLSRMTAVEARTETLVVDAAGDGDIDLTGTKAALIIFEGVRTGDGTVTFADDARSYFVIEDTSGDFTLSAKTDTGSDTIPIERGEMIRVWSDGAEIDVSLRRATFELGGPFGTSEIVVVKNDNGTNIYSLGEATHTSSSNPAAENLIPEWARPEQPFYAVTRFDATGLIEIGVTTAGAFFAQHRDWTGATVNRTKVSFVNISY